MREAAGGWGSGGDTDRAFVSADVETRIERTRSD